MEPTNNTVSASTTGIQSVGFDVLTPLLRVIDMGPAGFFSSGFFNFLKTIWSVFTVISFTLCIVMIVLYVFAAVRKNLYISLHTQALRDAEQLYAEQYQKSPRNNRLQNVLSHADSENPNDWKLAIIEADIILDDLLKQRGYIGSSLGERLRTIVPQQLQSIDDAWEAHKIRNRIAHDGSDFVLTKRLAKETITRYEKVFREFGLG